MKQILVMMAAVIVFVGCGDGGKKAAVEAKEQATIVEEAIRETLKQPEGELTDAHLKKVTDLRFRSTQITDAGLKEVSKLQNLEWLSLNGTKITDAGLKEVAKLQNLTYLNLDNTQITDAGLKEVAKLLKLHHLGLSNKEITDAGLKELAKLRNLKSLSLNGTKITDAGLKEVAKLQNLTYLNLGNTQTTDVGLKDVAKLQQLNTLWLNGTKITDAGVAELKNALPICQIEGLVAAKLANSEAKLKSPKEELNIDSTPKAEPGSKIKEPLTNEESAKVIFDVILVNDGGTAASKVATYLAVRQIQRGWGLKAAKEFVEAAPKAILYGVSKEEAEEAKRKLEAAGASVGLKFRSADMKAIGENSFDVILMNDGGTTASKVATILAVRQIQRGWGLKAAKEFVEAAPKAILYGVSKDEAEEAKRKLEAAGASVGLK